MRTIVLCLVVPAVIAVAPWALLHAVGWRLPSQEVPEALGPSIQSKVTLSLGCGLFVVFWGIGAVVRRASEVARRSSAAFAAWFTWLYASDAGLAILQNIDRPAVVRTDVFQPPTIAGAIQDAEVPASGHAGGHGRSPVLRSSQSKKSDTLPFKIERFACR